MRYKRESAFRYTFQEPLSALFTIKEIGGGSVTTSEGEAVIIDISPDGMKLTSELNIPEKVNQPTHLSIAFTLNEREMNVEGIIVWKKEKYITNDYGINLLTDEAAKQELVEELKVYSRKVNHMEN